MDTLAAGKTLPPVWELATELDANRNIVMTAYRRLVTSGLAQGLGRNDTVIKGATASVALEGGNPNTLLIDLSGGNPAPSRLPDLSSCFVEISKSPRSYGDAAVSPGLKVWTSQWMQNAVPGKGEIDIINGAIDAIGWLLCAYLLSGDNVVVENPCFLSNINMLCYAGLSASPANVDHEGMLPDQLELALQKGARAMIPTPRVHNPTGHSLNASRATQLQEILARYPQALMIIDDHFALLPARHWYLMIAKETTHWAIVRSMSKTLGPDLRLAIVTSDPLTSGKLRLWLSSGSQWVSRLLQGLACVCLSDETHQHILTQTQQSYIAQQQTLVVALRRHGIELLVGDGLNMWLLLENNSQAIAFAPVKSDRLVWEGEVLGANTSAHGLRITLSALTNSDIDKLAVDIHQALGR